MKWPATPPIVTEVIPVKFVPVMVSVSPAEADVGVKSVIVGTAAFEKSANNTNCDTSRIGFIKKSLKKDCEIAYYIARQLCGDKYCAEA
jgi:hypothetical protein